MRKILVMCFLLGFVGLSLGQERFECSSNSHAEWAESKASVSFPLPGLIARVLKKPESWLPGVDIEIFFQEPLKIRQDCACVTSCCPGPGEFHAQMDVYAIVPRRPSEPVPRPVEGEVATSLLASASNIWYIGAGEEVCGWPGANELTIPRGGVTIRVNLSWPLEVTETRVELNLCDACVCKPLQRCLDLARNHPPEFRRVPPQIAVPVGEEASFVVLVDDVDGDLLGFDVNKEIKEVYKGAVEELRDNEGRLIGAKITVPATFVKQEVLVMVKDECGHIRTVNIPVIAVHRPKLSVSEEKWEYGTYVVRGEVLDEDLSRCAKGEFFEMLSFKLGAHTSGGGEFKHDLWGPSWTVGCAWAPDGRAEWAGRYTPARGGDRLAYLFAQVTDAWGFVDYWSKKLYNEPPVLKFTSISPPASSPVKVRRGELVTVTVSAEDREGDEVTLRKVSGLGDFPTVQGRSFVSGTYTWVAEGFVPWHLVRFEAADQYPGSSYAYLLIHVLQPPLAYGGSVFVQRGGRTVAKIFVADHDSTAHTFFFSPPDGIAVVFKGKEDVPDYYGTYYGHLYSVEISVDGKLCPGVYAVPFTVTDPDGLSSSATLYVRVVGNQPPVVDSVSLEGTATVTLTPNGP